MHTVTIPGIINTEIMSHMEIAQLSQTYWRVECVSNKFIEEVLALRMFHISKSNEFWYVDGTRLLQQAMTLVALNGAHASSIRMYIDGSPRRLCAVSFVQMHTISWKRVSSLFLFAFILLESKAIFLFKLTFSLGFSLFLLDLGSQRKAKAQCIIYGATF